jgi:hypothetical protein
LNVGWVRRDLNVRVNFKGVHFKFCPEKGRIIVGVAKNVFGREALLPKGLKNCMFWYLRSHSSRLR